VEDQKNPFWNPSIVVGEDERSQQRRALLPSLSREQIEETIGGKIPEEVWGFNPWGHMLLVLRDPSPEISEGGIYIPDAAQQTLAAGIIIKVGPDVGVVTNKYSGSSPFVDPASLVGCHVVFGRWCGKTLTAQPVRERDDYSSEWLVMPEDDIWGDTPAGVDLPKRRAKELERKVIA
jgi:co-chaperonin GroES (HSP10)